MKALCIIGSPRKNGNTTVLVDKIIEGLSIGQADIAKYFLDDLKINFCKGCYSCETHRECVQDDDMGILISEIMASDVIVMASPSYWGGVTGQMKVFIDRCLPLCNAKTGETPVPAGKLGISVAVRAGSSPSENKHIMESFEHYFRHLNIEPVGSVTAESVDSEGEISNNKEILEKALNLGRAIAAQH